MPPTVAGDIEAAGRTPETVAPEASAALRPTAAVPAALPFTLLVEGEGDQPPRLAAELVAALRAEGSDIVPAVVQRSPAGMLAARPRVASSAPMLAIARYDELREAAAKAEAPLRVIAPLTTDDIYIVARADSPLRLIGHLKGGRLNLGAADGGRAVTGEQLYRQMFDAPAPIHPASALDAPAALHLLAEGGPIDAVVLVGARGRAELADLPAAERRKLRLLEAPIDDAATRKALRLYLPVQLEGVAGRPVASLASLGFLVAAGDPLTGAAPLAALARSLCKRLDALQRDGDPKWHDVQAGQSLPIALRPLDTQVIDADWARCGRAGANPTTVAAPAASVSSK